jgi:hypothetical protein
LIFDSPLSQSGDANGLDSLGVFTLFVGEKPAFLSPYAKGEGVGENTNRVVTGQLQEIGLDGDKIGGPILVHNTTQAAIGRPDVIGQKTEKTSIR